MRFSSLSRKGHDTVIDFHVYMKVILFMVLMLLESSFYTSYVLQIVVVLYNK